jgi:hypothetical protein
VSRAGAQDKEAPKTQPVTLAADLTAQAPAHWKSQKPKSKFRTHEFVLPATGQGKTDGFLMLTYFGPGGGGDLDANLERWYGMVEQPDGSSSADKAKPKVIQNGPVQSTWIDLPGTYLDRPAPMSDEVTKRPHYRMFAAMIDGGKDGPYWLRAWGPDDVMLSHRDGFERFLKSITQK